MAKPFTNPTPQERAENVKKTSLAVPCLCPVAIRLYQSPRRATTPCDDGVIVAKTSKPVPVLLVQLLTSSGIELESVMGATCSAPQSPVWLVEWHDGIEAALWLNSSDEQYVNQLVRFARPRRFQGQLFSWCLRDGVIGQEGNLAAVYREAPWACRSEEEAVLRFERATAGLEVDSLIDYDKLDTRDQDVFNAKWQAMQDVHRKSLKLLQGTDWASLSESEHISRCKQIQMEFALELKAYARIELPPLRNLPPQQRKSLSRRKPRVRLERREIAAHWRTKSYDQMRPPEIARKVTEVTGVPISADNVKTIRKRHGLTSLLPEGRPRKS